MSTEDKYETLEKIGHGSFGVIRKVRRKADSFIMCRKEISYLKMSQKEREQLHSEFQILSHLRHPNIVAYYHREHLKASQDLHLYMEYCGNGDLGRVIKNLKLKNQRAPESFVWSIFTQLVLALYRCHYGIDPPDVGTSVLGLTRGDAVPETPPGTMTILHRDLKPENVFLDEDNSVKLGDFGLSKIIKSHDFASTYVGTPFYMSPEICGAEKYTLKSDIWSLGCIIYELCARDPPFNAKTHFQLVQKIKEGKVPALPPMYSPEMNQVIKDCLRVDPDKRPDTPQLLNLPAVKLMRKEKEVVDLNKSLRQREEAVKRKERELSDKLASFDRQRAAMHEEIDASLRREWEVKAQLEITRLVSEEIERLRTHFDQEVQARVESELKKKAVPLPQPVQDPRPKENFGSSLERSDTRSTRSASLDRPQSPTGDYNSGGEDIFSSTDATEYSVESPDYSKEPKKTVRTPFGRAQTMFVGNVGTPMDVEMASPSPIAIASLSLSPRRNDTTKAPRAQTGNIFTTNANGGGGLGEAEWDLPRNGTPTADFDEWIATSPTRQIKSSKNPFTSKTRPVLTSQKTCPVNRLKTAQSSSGLVSKVGLRATPSQQNLHEQQSDPGYESGPRSPNRRLSKIPSAAALQSENHFMLASKKESSEALGKTAAKNNIKGRTLVELQQARAGGRPLSAVVGPSSSEPGSGSENSLPNVSPKRGMGNNFRDRIMGERRRSSGASVASSEPAAVWDPERDEMPSPFLVRHRRNPKV